jgi:hypothetical protein
MLAPERAAASLIYFVTLLGTLLSVFVLKVQPPLTCQHVTCPCHMHMHIWYRLSVFVLKVQRLSLLCPNPKP